MTLQLTPAASVEFSDSAWLERPAGQVNASITSSTRQYSHEALRRKRERDKESQRKKRRRERDYLVSLEGQVRDLKGMLKTLGTITNHNDAPTSAPAIDQPVPSPIAAHSTKGSAPNEVDHNYPPSYDRLLDRYPSDQHLSSLSSSKLSQPSQEHLQAVGDAYLDTPCSVVSPQPYERLSPPNSDSSERIFIAADLLDRLLTSPEWSRLPLQAPNPPEYILQFGDLNPLIKQLRESPDLAAKCTSLPKIMDLMFGGSSNLLANFVSRKVAHRPLLPAEKLACSWILYLYCKWYTQPTEENFAALPPFMKPSCYQLTQEHPMFFDFIPFPQLRTNMIKHQKSLDLMEVLPAFIRSCRIRGAFHIEFISRTNDGDPYIVEDFYQRFMDLNQWGILEFFWIDYPQLVEGLSRSHLLRDQDLIPG